MARDWIGEKARELNVPRQEVVRWMKLAELYPTVEDLKATFERFGADAIYAALDRGMRPEREN